MNSGITFLLKYMFPYNGAMVAHCLAQGKCTLSLNDRGQEHILSSSALIFMMCSLKIKSS